MTLFFNRIITVIVLTFFLSVAYFVSAASVSINANIPSSSGGGGGGGGTVTIFGCTDPVATNYNSSANSNDGSCLYAIPGCTNPLATNYNSSATVDNGSCILTISGCTNPLAINYNPSATVDNGSCILPVLGCTDVLATNFNALANQDNGTCIYQISGCTNPLATNFNALATIDSGTCIINGCTNPLATNFNSLATIDNGTCIIVGCTDPVAINYNGQATVDSGSCSYNPNDVAGCRDALALNYNSSATIDNGSCTYAVSGCTDPIALNFNPLATVNNGSCVYPLPIVPKSEDRKLSYFFYTNSNQLELFLINNNIDLLVGHELLIVVPNNFEKVIKKISAVIEGEIYTFKYDSNTDQFILSLDSFNVIEKNQINLLAVYDDNSSDAQIITVSVKPLGHIFSKLPDETARIFGITVLLYDSQNNLVTELTKLSPDGIYGFMVKNGRYKLVVFDNGQKVFDGNFFDVKNNIINRDLGLTLFEQIIKVIQTVIDDPVVEQVNSYVAPAVVSVVSVTTVAAIPWITLINYIQYLFTEPLAWFFRRRKKGWGVVYNSITKKPVDLAVVRLKDKKTGMIIKSKVTDKEGRYNFLVSGGEYIIEVIKPNMLFPSSILKDALEDKQFTNLYHGESINIAQNQKGIITANIPLDQAGITDTDKQIIRKNYWHKIQKNISLIGPIFSIVSFIIFPSILIGSFAVVHIILYLLFKRLVAKEKVNKWGVILDATTGKPVAGTITKIYSPEYNKMLETQVTDSHGRYGFLAGNNVYYISAAKNGYLEAKTNNLDLTHKKSEEVIGQDINLQPLGTSNSSIEKNLPEVENIIGNSITSDENKKELSPLDEMALKINRQAELQQNKKVESDVNKPLDMSATTNQLVATKNNQDGELNPIESSTNSIKAPGNENKFG